MFVSKTPLLDALVAAVPQVAALSPESQRFLQENTRSLQLAAGDHWQPWGEIRGEIGLMTTGLCKVYSTKSDGTNYTLSFVKENGIVTDYLGNLGVNPSPIGIQALEPSTIFCLEFARHTELVQRDHSWALVALVCQQSLLIALADRERQLMTLSPEERWLDFVAQHPALANRLSQKEIAMYLGISAVSLSRMLARRRRRRFHEVRNIDPCLD